MHDDRGRQGPLTGRLATIPVRPKVRVRTGCQQCRAKRVKCSEEKPACKRCLRTGTACRYATSKTVDKVAPRPILPAKESGLVALVRSNPGQIDVAADEGIYFDHFRHYVVNQLGSQRPVNFWLQTIMRECARDEGVKHGVIAIGALSLTAFGRLPSRPLYKMLSSGPSAMSEHYTTAMSHYVNALSSFRGRLAGDGSSPRGVLIFTMLFMVFELLQGNTDAVDKLIAHGATTLKDQLIYTPADDTQPRIAAAMDDLGVQAAEMLFARTLAFNSYFSPMYPLAKQSTWSLNYTLDNLVVPDPELPDDRFWTALWRSVTMTAIANDRIRRRVLQGDPIHPGSEVHDDQQKLLVYVESWSQSLRTKLTYDISLLTRLHLDLALAGTDCTVVSIRCALDATGTAWDGYRDTCLRTLKKFLPYVESEPQGASSRSIVLDGMLPALLVVVRDCRDSEVRALGMRILGILITQSSSWDIKGIYLGIKAQLLVEDGFRDEDGHVAADCRFEWTRGYWSDSYTEFHVTLTRHGQPPGANVTQTVVLRSDDFKLV